MRNTDSPSAPQILELAKSHFKPRKHLVEMAKERAKAMEESAKNAEKNKSPPVNDIPLDEKKLVMLTLVVPFLNTTDYFDLLGLNYREGSSAKSDAIDRKLLIEHRIHIGKRGGQSVLLEPSRASFSMFGLPPQYENPGFLHKYLQHQAKVAMTARGHRVAVEKSINGKSIDLLLQSDKETVAVEIAVTPKHEIVNVRKDIFKAGVDKVVIIGKDRKVVSAVKKKIADAFSDDVLAKVSVNTLSEFIAEFS